MTEVFRITEFLSSKERSNLVTIAVNLLKEGGIIVMPSDTMYGLFSDFKPRQIDRMHQIKNRDKKIPFLYVFPEKYPLDEFVKMSDLTVEMVKHLAELWPGSHTFLFPKNENINYPEGDTIAIRKPSRTPGDFFYDTLNMYNKPLLAPSLNTHGGQPLDKLSDMINEFCDKVDAIFFDDNYKAGEASHIWDLTKTPFVRIR